MAVPPTPANTCGVLVTYRPDDDVAGRIAAVAAQVGHAVVVDNGSDPAVVGRLRRVVRGVEWVCNPSNLGIATALNQGLRHAAGRGCDWALTMDQDSRAHGDLLAGLRAAYDGCPFRGRLGTLAANFDDRHRGRPWVATGTAGGRAYVEQAVAITSGSLVSVPAWRAVGPYRDDFFVDFVDHEFSLRLRRRGWRVAYTTAPLIDHAVGRPTPIKLLPGVRPAATSNHSALRRYYITRNRLVTAAAYAGGETRTCLLDGIRAVAEAGAVVLLEADRWAKVWAMATGVRDAVIGGMGEKLSVESRELPRRSG